MPGMSGLHLAAAVKALAPLMPVVLVTGFGVLMDAGDAGALGADGILTKPITAKTLRASLAANVSASSWPHDLSH